MSLDTMKQRLNWHGGKCSDDRNVRGKYLSFKSALENSYQAEWITLNGKKQRCLINPDKLKADYDIKEISIDFMSKIDVGSVFTWDRTKTNWLVTLQQLTEEAYFRGEIRICNYTLCINRTHYPIAVRGPVETAMIWRQKHKIEMNDLNYSIMFYITGNEETKEFFTRHQRVKFDGHNWKVAATDKYSQPGIIEVYLEEDFDNTMEDYQNEPNTIDFTDVRSPYIDGPQIVRPFDKKLVYSLRNELLSGSFVVSSTKVKINQTNENSCELEILTGKSTTFDLIYKYDDETKEDLVLHITVKSL